MKFEAFVYQVRMEIYLNQALTGKNVIKWLINTVKLNIWK